MAETPVTPTPAAAPISRKSVLTAAAWATPVVAATAASPALAATTPAATIATTSLPAAYVGTPYNQQVVTDPVSNNVRATGLPAGLVVTPTGVVTGSPTAQGLSTANFSAPARTRAPGDTVPIEIAVAANRAAIEAAVLAAVNARRTGLGRAALAAPNARLLTVARAWSDHLADIRNLVHQVLGDIQADSENLSMIAGAPAAGQAARTAADVGAALAAGWLAERHSYDEWVAAGRSMDMFNGTGAYAAAGASGHRINIENPDYTGGAIGVTFRVYPGEGAAYFATHDFLR